MKKIVFVLLFVLSASSFAQEDDIGAIDPIDDVPPPPPPVEPDEPYIPPDDGNGEFNEPPPGGAYVPPADVPGGGRGGAPRFGRPNRPGIGAGMGPAGGEGAVTFKLSGEKMSAEDIENKALKIRLEQIQRQLKRKF